MKALISAFGLLAFVAASTVPYVAHAQSASEQPAKKHKKATKKHVKKASKGKKGSKKAAKKAA